MQKEVLPDTQYIPGSLKSYAQGRDKIHEIEREGIAAIGQADLIAYHRGGRLYASRAIHAYCYDCMGYYADGKTDCKQAYCPLYPFMPYAQKKDVPADQLDVMPEKNGQAPDSSIGAKLNRRDHV
jgi:hypothetical protein